MLYERQLCSVYDEKRIEKVKDLIDSTNESIIVFYNFDAELEQIKTIGSDQKHEVGVICGFDKSGKDMLNYSLNHNYRYTPILAIQYQSGSMGLNLQSFARRIIYYSLPLSSELFEQSKKRIHRIGQKQKCFYYILMSKNSIEEQIYRTLKKRNDYTQELFKKGW